MAFCSKCGSAFSTAAAFCGACGTAASGSGEKPSNTESAAEVSDTWKQKFALIEKAGGPKLPKFSDLASGERAKAIFNIWGFLFGPFYYLAKGMWKKAIVLTLLVFAIILVLDMLLGDSRLSIITNFIAPALFAVRANIDFYKKAVLADNGWW